MARHKTNETPQPQEPQRAVPPLNGVRLQPFSGDKHSCAKCGHAGAKTIYLPAGSICTHCHAEGFRNLWGQERLHRICNLCGFSWDEACVPPVLEPKDTLLMPVVPSAKGERRYG